MRRARRGADAMVFRVRYGAGEYVPVLLHLGASPLDVKEAVAATVGLEDNTFCIKNAAGSALLPRRPRRRLGRRAAAEAGGGACRARGGRCGRWRMGAL